jgi:TonB family protein
VEKDDKTPRFEENPAMFGHLLASRPSRNVRGSLTSTATSIALHALIISGLVVATISAAETPAGKELLTLTKLNTTVTPLPPPPEAVSAAPVAAAAAPAGFPALPTPDVVPDVIPLQTSNPGFRPEDYLRPIGQAGGTPGGTGKDSIDDAAKQPFITPMDVNPKLLNHAEVEKIVSRNYPSVMRDAGIAGRTNVWIRVDEEGKAVAWQVKKTSGFDALDSAAVRVAPSLRFTPAMNLGHPVAVWISMDIVFTIR